MYSPTVISLLLIFVRSRWGRGLVRTVMVEVPVEQDRGLRRRYNGLGGERGVLGTGSGWNGW